MILSLSILFGYFYIIFNTIKTKSYKNKEYFKFFVCKDKFYCWAFYSIFKIQNNLFNTMSVNLQQWQTIKRIQLSHTIYCQLHQALQHIFRILNNFFGRQQNYSGLNPYFCTIIRGIIESIPIFDQQNQRKFWKKLNKSQHFEESHIIKQFDSFDHIQDVNNNYNF
ncbi:unnamed protein product [Paramecium primaurelia]|uniref:Uncharacterized protein n=1 Tax=Paramecium primaurelia TaxID=5886 RepID=A0A8S1QW66_PARPR|nr:unnamed protein product [Paramecium primaurelia]